MSLKVDIHKRLGAFHLRVRFEISEGVLALLGDSGCGKSMTLRCIAGLERPDSGRIVLNGRILFDSEKHIDLPPQKRRVGILLQQSALFPNMTVMQNLRVAVRHLPRPEQDRKIRERLSLYGMEDLEERRPSELSGGQQQRVAMARVLLSNPELLLLDEPFTALDETVQWKLELDLLDLLQGYSGDAIFVSHSRDEVCRICDRVCVLTEGRSEPMLPVSELMRNPGTCSTARLSGCKNISPVRVTEKGLYCEAWGVALDPGRPVDSSVTHVGLRAHDLWISDSGRNRIPCRLIRSIDNVFSVILMLQTPGGGLLRMEHSKESFLGPAGESCCVCIAPDRILLLKEGGSDD